MIYCNHEKKNLFKSGGNWCYDLHMSTPTDILLLSSDIAHILKIPQLSKVWSTYRTSMQNVRH